ncbi:MAG: helix-turn-helix domain-containing protein [Alphaproteobacteria bacterium]|nr:helix-turn-helix domain-containing protein [Alphaproteobacteria bacterium]
MAKKNLIIERGKRLQALRKKVGLTRLAFAEQTGMSANTLKALELGDRELTPQKALLFSNLFSGLFSVSLGEDVHEASFDYLFYGKKDNPHEQKELFINDSDDLRMQNEISSLKSNPSYATLQIQDELMSPLFNKGDIVAGKKIVNKSHFPYYQGCICIIESLEGNLMLRRVIKSDNRLITSCILNTNINSSTNIIEECEVKYIAQAIWHWHLSQLLKTLPTSD